jgi:hypothetical protein
MKKILTVGLIVALALIIIGGAGIAYAQARGIGFNRFVAADESPLRQLGVTPGEMMYGYGPGGMMGGTGPGFNQGGTRPGYGSGGMMGGSRSNVGPGYYGEYGFGPGMMGGSELGVGFLHDYMLSAFAEAVGLTVDEVQTRFNNGETIRDIALAQGTAEADFPALLTQVRTAALDKAVADDSITQEQADLMLQRMSNYQGQGFGPGYDAGNCPMLDGQLQP